MATVGLLHPGEMGTALAEALALSRARAPASSAARDAHGRSARGRDDAALRQAVLGSRRSGHPAGFDLANRSLLWGYQYPRTQVINPYISRRNGDGAADPFGTGGGRWTRWYELGAWSSDSGPERRQSVKDQRDSDGGGVLELRSGPVEDREQNSRGRGSEAETGSV